MASRAKTRVQSHRKTVTTHRGADSAIAVMSHRPAGATKCAPERLEIRNRQGARPGLSMVVAVEGAVVAAAAPHRELGHRGPGRFFPILPGGIAAVAAHRRPIRHRW